MRRLPAAASLLAILVVQAPPARAAPPGRVVVVTVDGTGLADWKRTGLPAFGALLDRGALGLLSTRTAKTETAVPGMRREAYRTLGAGRVGSTSDPTTLIRALQNAGLAANVIASSIAGASSLSQTSVPLPERSDGAFPGSVRTDYPALRTIVTSALTTSQVIVVDTGDPARVEQALGDDARAREHWMGLSLTRADEFLSWLRDQLTTDDLLVVASLTPTRERQHARRYLSAIAMTGAGVPPGLVTTRTTGRDGVATIADLAPTILDGVGIAAPGAMTGRPLRVARDDRAAERVARLESGFIHASIVRGPLLRASIWIAGALAVLSLLTVLSGRGLAGRERGLPATWRAFLETGLLAVATVPFVLLLEPLFRTGSLTATASAVGGAALALALAMRAAFGSRAAFAAVCAATAVVVVADLAAGGSLAARSPLSYLIAEGARFHGIGNEVMGVLIGSVLLGGAALLDRGRGGIRRDLVLASSIVAVVVMAAPNLGAKFGSIPAAVPALALFGLYAVGIRLGPRSVVAVGLVTVLAADIAIVADALRNPEVQSHVGRAVGGGGGEILGRKVGAAGRLLALSFWAVGTVMCGGSAAVLAWRRPALVGRGLWGGPAVRRALLCCAVAGVAAIATNDAGVTAAAWIGVLAACGFFTRLLVPSDP